MPDHRDIKGCLAGRILRVDLTHRKIWTEDSRAYAAETLGGRGVNTRIMLQEMDPGTKWSDPGNLLCLGAGSLVGTMVPGACRVDVSTKNVFSGGKGSANVGGFWGQELKYAGYDNLIIEGKSESPVYLLITDDQVQIRDASFIWGETTFAAEALLRRELGDNGIRIALIGPAGENMIRGSAIIVDTARAAGGSGVGCVMGDKKLKAVVVRGRGAIAAAEPERFMREVDRCLRQCAREPRLKSMRQSLSNFFADPHLSCWDAIITARNGQDDYWEHEKRIRLMNPENGVPCLRKGMRACYVCPTGCQSYMEIPAGRPYGGARGEGFWVNTILSHACRMDISQPETVVYAWMLTNELGLDADYAGSMLAWAFELYEMGAITEADTDGLELTWGNGAAFVAMLKKLARREGIGDVLADGPAVAAREFGEGSGYFLSQLAGQPSVESFRIAKGWCLAICTSPVAGRHLRGATVGDERFGPRPRSQGLDPAGYERQAEHTHWQARTKELEDNLGICNYCGTWSGANFMGPDNYAELVSSGMGLEVDQNDLMNHFAPLGRNLEKAFNSLHTDLGRKDDQPPERFCREPVRSGPYKGARAGGPQFDRMLDEYYRLWGWDVETGLQTRTCLEKIGLTEVADQLARCGRLVDK